MTTNHLLQSALDTFKTVVLSAPQHHGQVALAKEGWTELPPNEKYWSFTHADFPEVVVHWQPSKSMWAEQSTTFHVR